MLILIYDPLPWLAFLPVVLIPLLVRRAMGIGSSDESVAVPNGRLSRTYSEGVLLAANGGWVVLTSGLLSGSPVVLWYGLLILDAAVAAALAWIAGLAFIPAARRRL